MTESKTVLVLGGIRSGKTALAEKISVQLSSDTGLQIAYLATAAALDEEMTLRITRHQQSRPQHWLLAEQQIALAKAVDKFASMAEPPVLLVDCMSLWVSNLLHAGESVFERERRLFLDAMLSYPGAMVIVSNETGLGVIGMDALTRRFCDELGWLNQALAERCDRVVMSIAGLDLVLKGHS
jgi:adenosylcobinamide kinase/adenosylcobinamide-phosphate guanylyltransferase